MSYTFVYVYTYFSMMSYNNKIEEKKMPREQNSSNFSAFVDRGSILNMSGSSFI